MDLYLLRLMLRPMGAALGITLVALLMERALRLFDLISSSGAGFAPVLTMMLGLTPHYLGLALPAAFCVALLSTLGELSRGNELDALESAGWSLRRIGMAFVASGVILSLLGVVLFGYVQPYSRYAYRAAKHAVEQAGWTGRVTEGVFLDLGDGMVLSAAEVDPSGRVLSEVFLLVRSDDGETATTARQGVVVPDLEERVVRLRLEDGVSLGPSGTLRFDRLVLAREFGLDSDPFRARGRSREMTLGELAAAAGREDGPPPDPGLEAELHARLVRAVSLIGIALAAVPLGVVGKRGRSWPRILAALAGLTAYHHLLLFLESLGALRRIDPALGLWGACAVFLLGSLALYLGTAGQSPSMLRPAPARLFRRSPGAQRPPPPP